MSYLFFTAPTEPRRGRARKRPGPRPSRSRTFFTWALLVIWAVLISFGAASCLKPDLLEEWARLGVQAESWAYKDYGDTLLRQGNYRLAIAQYQRSLDIRPGHERVMVNLAIAYIRAGDPGRGAQILQDVLQMEPSHNLKGVIYYNLAEVFEQLGRRDEAINYYQQAADHEVAPDVVYRRPGSLYLAAGRFEPARAAFEKTLAGQLDLARSYQHMLRQSIDIYENNERHLSIIEAELGHHRRAEELPEYDFEIIRQSLQGDREIAKTHNHLGYIYARLGNIPKAIEHFEASLHVWPDSDNVDANTNLPKLRQSLQHQPAAAPPPP